MWAASTQANYARLAHRWQEYAKSKREEVWAASTITSWLLSETCEPAAKHSYLKVAKAIRSAREKLLHSSTDLLSKHLRGDGALIPQRQAPPLKRELLDHPIFIPHRLAVLLAWSSASRWDEISRLTKESFIAIAPDEVIVDWFTGTKATRTQPFRASRFTVIRSRYVAEIADRLLRLKSEEPVTQLTTSQITTLLRKAAPEENLSAHSFKAGALDEVAFRLSTAQPPLPHLEQEVALARLAKHVHALDPNPTTLRYIRTPEHLARMLGTGKTTELL
jgi:hypothetical protein